MSSLVIFEKDPAWQQILSAALSTDYELHFHDGSEAREVLATTHFQGIVLDVLSAPDGAFKLLDWIVSIVPDTPVIMTSLSENAEVVVKAIKGGAFDFVVKPYDPARIYHVVQKALEDRCNRNEINYLRHEQDVIYNFDRVVAESDNMKAIVQTLRRFAQTDAAILMTGETGTGKSFLSGTVHFNSHRKARPFVKVNCANIPETLLESELFGHERGAFTGADKQRVGRFEQAHGGTLFLDEVGEMSLTLQAKLLRVLEEKAFERLGGNRTIRSNVRIIAATNRDLKRMIAAGDFREDLYYRIHVLSVRLPPLRERRLCIEPLARFLLLKACRSVGKHIEGFSPAAITVLQTGAWRGNIRQLANAIERAVILTDRGRIDAECLPPPDSAPPEAAPAGAPPTEASSLALQERQTLIKALDECLWIQKDAAKSLGISPRALNYKIKKYAITHPRWRKHRG